MSPLILASQSQALPLLLLPLAMAAGHPVSKPRHLHTHVQAVAATPMLFPVSDSACGQNNGVLRQSGGRYTIVIDPRFDPR